MLKNWNKTKKKYLKIMKNDEKLGKNHQKCRKIIKNIE